LKHAIVFVDGAVLRDERGLRFPLLEGDAFESRLQGRALGHELLAQGRLIDSGAADACGGQSRLSDSRGHFACVARQDDGIQRVLSSPRAMQKGAEAVQGKHAIFYRLDDGG
jgi:hypothetical protein